MASQKFLTHIYYDAQNKLNSVLSAQIYYQLMGSGADQYQGLGSDLASIIPFNSQEYEAQEYIYMRMSLNDPLVPCIDFIAPVLNIGSSSIQGVGTYLAATPNAISETHVHRMYGLIKGGLFAHGSVVDQHISAKDIMNGGLQSSPAVTNINNDEGLCHNIMSCCECTIKGDFRSYTVRLETSNYPPGLFTAIPYYGYTVMIAKEAGTLWGPGVDAPSYDFAAKYKAFMGVAKYLANSQEPVYEQVGRFYSDKALSIILPPMLQYIKSTQGYV